jgi:hypothetical protein
LLDMASFLFEEFGISITKQSLHDRFTAQAVAFLKKCLDILLFQKIRYQGDKELLKSHFKRIRIKDSTKFSLPDPFSEKYRGYGGALSQSSSMISIQYEYDFISGQSMDLRLTSGVLNDQSDSAEFTHDIREQDLFLRDLGYCTVKFMTKIHSAGAYFINRLGPQVNCYPDLDSKNPIDLNKYLHKLKKDKLDYIEVSVFLGSKDRVPARLILSLADENTYQKRLKKTTKQAKSTGHNVSEKFKARAILNIMVTNVPAEVLKTNEIRKIYAMRWQIELIFKVWKSLATIDEFNSKKIHRFECQLYGKLIWIILNLKIFNHIQKQVYSQNKILCSIWKYFRLIQNIQNYLIKAVKKHKEFQFLIKRLIDYAPKAIYLEKKKGKLALEHIIVLLA